MVEGFRARPRRVIAPILVLAAVAAVTAVLKASQTPPWLSWMPAWLSVVAVAVLAVVVVAAVEPWAKRRHEEAGSERGAVRRLRDHLGRQDLRMFRDVDPAALRVHPAIDLPTDGLQPRSGRAHGVATHRIPRQGRHVSAAKVDAQADYRRYGYLPAWVERGKENNVLQWLREASESGGFLVIVGDSSVGKTRLLYETVLDVLPDWFVLVPDLGEGDVVNAVADSTFRLPKLVVWLDELQRFLPGPYLTE